MTPGHSVCFGTHTENGLFLEGSFALMLRRDANNVMLQYVWKSDSFACSELWGGLVLTFHTFTLSDMLTS